jgi:hypothetical protein
MPDCVHCGGSGVLNIEMSNEHGTWESDLRAASCHACEMGKIMAEVGLDA